MSLNFDLILHDYGPDQYSGSIHIEVPDTLNVTQIDKISRRITKHIQEQFGITLHTVGVYSANTKDEKLKKKLNEIHEIVFKHEGILQMHGFYFDEQDKMIRFDIVMDFKVPDREKVCQEIYDEVQKKYPGYDISINVDIDISD